MRKISLATAIAIMTSVPVVAFAHPGGPGSGAGPAGGTFWANDIEHA